MSNNEGIGVNMRLLINFTLISLGVLAAVAIGAAQFVTRPAPLLELEASAAPAGRTPGAVRFSLLFPTPAAVPDVLSDTVAVYLPTMLRRFDPSYESPMGISMYLTVEPTTGLNHMRAAGAGWVITYLRWAEIQPTGPTDFNWSIADANFANAAAAGLKIHALFDINPAWVTDNPRGPIPADKLDEFEAMVTAMVDRYDGTDGQPRVDHWSFYGEPDNNVSWGNHGAEYAALMARVTPIIRAHNPNAVIILSGIAYDKFTDDTVNPPGRFVRRFITDTLQALTTFPGGVPAYIDQVGFNFYPISLPRWPTIREKAAEIRSVMANHGAGHLPLAVTEMSMWSNWPPELGGENQAQQAHYLVHFYARGLSVGIRQLYWFQVFDVFPEYPGSAQGLFKGPMEEALNHPKQAYFAYQTLARELEQAHFSHVLSAPGTEGYVFRRGAETITVVWGTGQAPVQLDFTQTCARRVGVLGNASQIPDGGAGDLDASVNGRIRLQVSFEQPVYVATCP